MIYNKTPYRISFFGGGTDYPAWYLKHGGAVLATTIDKYLHLTCRYLPPFFEHKHRIVVSKIEAVKTVAEIEHAPVRAVLEDVGWTEGIELHYQGDLPARAGLGSSSAFTVAMIQVIQGMLGDTLSKKEVAKKAIHLEQKVMAETVGSQDQICASYGGFNLIKFSADGDFDVTPVKISRERLANFQDHLMLFFTGYFRTASHVAKAQVESIDKKTKELHAMFQMVEEAQSILASGGSLNAFGSLLNDFWLLKKSLSPLVSTGSIDEIYAKGRKAGALGGKLLGAGGGGFILFFVRPEHRPQLLKAMAPLIHVPFRFESDGSNNIMAPAIERIARAA